MTTGQLDMADIPSAAPPPGSVSNFHATDTQYPALLATAVCCFVLTTLLTVARLIAKRAISSWSLEDCEFSFADVLEVTVV